MPASPKTFSLEFPMETPKSFDRPRLPVLFAVFFKISAVTVGGGLTMIPVMEREFLEKRRWLTEEDMVDTVALVQSMPGIIAVNMALIMGYRMAKLPGAFTAALAVILPPFFSILIIASCFATISGQETVSAAFRSVRAAVCALILLSALKLGKKLLKRAFPVAVAVLAFLVFVFLPQVNAALVIALAGLAGWIVRTPREEEEERKS